MPTARELLEQADALMKRNRARAEDDAIPELTDVVPDLELETPAPAAGAGEVWKTGGTLGTLEPGPVTESFGGEGEPSAWLDEASLGEASVTGKPPDSVILVPPATPTVQRTDAPVASTGPTEPIRHADEPSVARERAAAEPAVSSASVDADMARWEALADEIRMQVLQRIDLFTDAGLKEQLIERLQPAVDRASAELVGTISQHVGQLLRAYVAEAIEREIERWRQGRE